ncbi:MAG: hypothetical protein ACE5HV_00220 [Acidobacteriota bacterium]
MKPGINTSEFYVFVIAAVVVLVNKYAGLGLTGGELQALLLGAGSYVVSRGVAKAGSKK